MIGTHVVCVNNKIEPNFMISEITFVVNKPVNYVKKLRLEKFLGSCVL